MENLMALERCTSTTDHCFWDALHREKQRAQDCTFYPMDHILRDASTTTRPHALMANFTHQNFTMKGRSRITSSMDRVSSIQIIINSLVSILMARNIMAN